MKSLEKGARLRLLEEMKGTEFWLKIRYEDSKVFYLSASLLQMAWVTLWRPFNCSMPL